MPMILMDKNENRYGPSPACLAALKAVDPEILFAYCRTHSGRGDHLKGRLSVLHGIEPRHILLGYGCESILIEAIRQLAAPGDRVLLPAPAWWYYTTLIDGVGAKAAYCPLIETDTAYAYNVEALNAMAADPFSLLIVASPNNPTGNSFPRHHLEEILRRYREVPVILDQAYFGLSDTDDSGYARLVGQFRNLLILRTFSKLYGLAGVRIGYGLMGDAMAERIGSCAPTLGYNRLSELLAVAALDSADYYRCIRSSMCQDRARICRFFRSLEGFRAYDSDANFVLVRFPSPAGSLLKRGLTERGLIVKFLNEPGLQDCLRISIGTAEETTLLLGACAEILGAPGTSA